MARRLSRENQYGMAFAPSPIVPCVRRLSTVLPRPKFGGLSCSSQRRLSHAGRRWMPARMMSEDPVGDENPLTSPDFLTRVRAINDQRQRGAVQVIAALLPLATSDKNPQVRYSAISQLAGLDRAEVSDEDKSKLLETALSIIKNDTDSSCQSGAADVIAGLGLTDGFETLVGTYHETSDWMLKLTIAAGMGEIGDPRASEFLRSALGSAEGEGNELLLTAIIGALGDIRNPDALNVIEPFLEHPDVSIRQRAAIAVELIKNP